MSHADEFIVSVHKSISAQVRALPDAIALMDEPSGDFGIAHFNGITDEWGTDSRFKYYGTNKDGIAVMTFDKGSTPFRSVVVHEFGHAVDDNTDGASDRWVVGAVRRQFWEARGLPGTPADSDARAQQLAIEGQRYESWRHWAGEIFAECFAACYVDGYNERTQTYGVPLDKDKMRAFFGGLRSNYEEEDDMNAEQTKALIREMVKSPEGALLVREALTRPDADADPGVQRQLDETEQRVRRWVVGL